MPKQNLRNSEKENRRSDCCPWLHMALFLLAIRSAMCGIISHSTQREFSSLFCCWIMLHSIIYFRKILYDTFFIFGRPCNLHFNLVRAFFFYYYFKNGTTMLDHGRFLFIIINSFCPFPHGMSVGNKFDMPTNNRLDTGFSKLYLL